MENDLKKYSHLTEHITIFEPQNSWVDELYEVQKCRSTDLKALKF